MFSINCLEITASKSQWEENKSLYKNLLSDKDYDDFEKDNANREPFRKRFFFNDFYKKEQHGNLEKNQNRALPENFFGNNINVQAIVGKNGSGKSTLMDLMYMAINNFSYMFERGNKHKRPNAAEFFFVPKLCANLYFSFNNQIYILACNDNRILLKLKDKEPPIFDTILNDIERGLSPEQKELAKNLYKEKDENIASLLSSFFYTIVSNYSIQSFLEINYKKNLYHHIDESEVTERPYYTSYENKYKNSDYNKDTRGNQFEQSWVSPLFSKKNTCFCPIVLNPYRESGKIDFSKELELSKHYFCSLLIYSELRKDVIYFKPYRYSLIKMKINNSKLFDWCTSIMVHYITSPYALPNFFSNLKDSVEHGGSFIKHIKEIFNLQQYENLKDLYWHSIVYIEFKLLKIIKKYNSFQKYYNKAIEVRTRGEDFYIKVYDETLLDEFLKNVYNDKTLITKQIRQTISFLSHANDIKKEDDELFISLNDFKKFFEKEHNLSPQLIDDSLPPPFFDWEILLNKETDNGGLILDETNGNPLNYSYSLLSSGEIQFIQTTSIHAYHLTNLISAPNDPKQPKYNRFNIVFDEVEICFHPEMQRQFLKRFIDMLKDLKVNDENYVNISIITHSPFILSDIPASNVLFLEEGTQNVSKNKKTLSFAQNIGEMMYDSFFMKKTIGDFAEAKLKELIKWKQGKNPFMSKKEADAILNAIGDPVIRSLIEEVGKDEVSDD